MSTLLTCLLVLGAVAAAMWFALLMANTVAVTTGLMVEGGPADRVISKALYCLGWATYCLFAAFGMLATFRYFAGRFA